MAEHIKREDIKRLVNNNFSGLLAAIDLIPAADAAPVVRCKDCKYLANATVNSNGFLICHATGMEISPEDFCSYAEEDK